jgi:hypothetical protein
MARHEVVYVEGHQPLAALTDGRHQDGEILGIGDVSVRRKVPPGRVRDHAKRSLYQEAKGGQGIWDLCGEVAFCLDDRLARRYGVDQRDLAQAQSNQTRAVLAGRCRSGKDHIGIDKDQSLLLVGISVSVVTFALLSQPVQQLLGGQPCFQA